MLDRIAACGLFRLGALNDTGPLSLEAVQRGAQTCPLRSLCPKTMDETTDLVDIGEDNCKSCHACQDRKPDPTSSVPGRVKTAGVGKKRFAVGADQCRDFRHSIISRRGRNRRSLSDSSSLKLGCSLMIVVRTR